MMTVHSRFGHLKKKYPNADPLAMVEKMERDLKAYPEFHRTGKKPIWTHTEITPDTIHWLREVAEILCGE